MSCGAVCLQQESPRDRPSRQSARRSLRPPRVLDCRAPIVFEFEIAGILFSSFPSHPPTDKASAVFSPSQFHRRGRPGPHFQSPNVPLSTSSWDPDCDMANLSGGPFHGPPHRYCVRFNVTGGCNLSRLCANSKYGTRRHLTAQGRRFIPRRPKSNGAPPGTPDLQLPWHAGTCQKTCTWWRSPSISSRSHPLTAKTWTRPNEAGLGVVGAVPDCHPIAHWIFAHDLVPQEESLREPNFHVLHSTSTKMPRKRLQIWQGWMQPQRVPRHFPRKTADRGRGTRWWRDAVSIGQSGPGLAEGGNLPVILSCKRGISISL